MKKYILITFALLLLFTISAENKPSAYIIPFIIDFNNSDKKLQEKATIYFLEELKKQNFYEIVERSKYERFIKELKINERNVYELKSLYSFAEKAGKGYYFYGKIEKEENNLKTVVTLFDPEGRSTCPFTVSDKIVNQDISEAIHSEIVKSVKNIIDTLRYYQKFKYNLTKKEMFDILKKYSFESYAILSEVEKSDGNKVNIMMYIRNRSSMSTEVSTTVHEFTHYWTSMHVSLGNNNKVIRPLFITPEKTINVVLTETFPSKELADFVPTELRNSTYDLYLADRESLRKEYGTQVYGIYGYLDEFVAYYQGAKAAVGLYDYYLENFYDKNHDSLRDFAFTANAECKAYYQFKYFIFAYLIYAKEKHPAIYQKIINNTNFIQAFIEINKSYQKLIEKIPKINTSLKKLSRTTITTFDDEINKLKNELKKDIYVNLEKELFK